MAARTPKKEIPKCVYCTLVENLYPEKIAPSLYEESELSSGTLEEVTLTVGISRRAAVKTILKKLVSYQKGKGLGRECLDSLAKALSQNYEHLTQHLMCATVEDLRKCRCIKGQYEKPFQSLLKVRSKLHLNDYLDLSDTAPHPTENSDYLPRVTCEDDQSNRGDDNEKDEGQCWSEGATEMYLDTFPFQGLRMEEHPTAQHGLTDDCELFPNQRKRFEYHGNKKYGQVKAQEMMRYLASKTVKPSSDWDEFCELGETVKEPDETSARTKMQHIFTEHSETDRHQTGNNQKLHLEGQKVHAEGQKMTLLRTPGFARLAEKDHRRLLITCSEMHLLLDNGRLDDFVTYTDLLLAKFPDSVDMKIHVLHHMVDAQCAANRVSSQTYKILEETQKLLPKSNNPLFFEMNHIFTHIKVLRKERKYGMAEDYSNCLNQKSQLLFIQHMIMCQKRRDAEYLIHQFKNKFTTNSVPERIFNTVEDLYLCSLHHAARFQAFLRKSEATAEYADKCNCYASGRVYLIQLALLHLRCCVTFKGTNEDFAIDSESIAKAEQCLQKVLERWEGISSRTEGKYLLAMSDLHLRKKQYLKAMKFANEALELCTERNQLSMVEWAERRIRYLERRIGVNGVDVDRDEVSSGCEAGPSSGVDNS